LSFAPVTTRRPLVEQTSGLCPVCLRSVPAEIREAEGCIWLERVCPRHGAATALLASDANEYLRLRQYVPPRASGCCGTGEVCDPGTPPVCVLLVEITRACNLRCPTCYADAQGHEFESPESVRKRLETFFAKQPRLDVLMLSGGEPTIHPRFAEILDLVLEYPVHRVLVNTNGLRFVQDGALRDSISRRKDRVELYLSFASFRAPTHERLYGKDLRQVKQKAVELAGESGVFVTLVPTVERGVNEDELGDIYRYALTRDNVNGITFQPVMSAGRYEHSYDPRDRLTMTDVLRMLEEQTEGDLCRSDFVGLPCSHPDCCSLTYGFLDARREKITPLPRHLDVARYLDLFADRISFSGLLGGAARRIWSDVVHFRSGRTLKDLGVLFAKGGLRDVIPLMRDPEAFGRRVFRVVVKPFMDAHTYDESRIRQCCTMILNEQGQPVSFCEYNVFHRGRKPRASTIVLEPRRLQSV
jgi:7,8-dihydro-6-hydroxymethylpterin dimethyltransferase